jgi:hypothetical protein
MGEASMCSSAATELELSRAFFHEAVLPIARVAHRRVVPPALDAAAHV